MNVLQPLLDCAGRWVGTSVLQDPPRIQRDESPSTAVVTPILGSRFVRLEYTWRHGQAPQEGVILIGYNAAAGEVSAHWIDSWHMGDKVMACRGAVGENGQLDVRGSYAAPPGPDWGWRTVVSPGDNDLRIVMYNVTPEGREELAVEAKYVRV
jgi:hypothetical protein